MKLFLLQFVFSTFLFFPLASQTSSYKYTVPSLLLFPFKWNLVPTLWSWYCWCSVAKSCLTFCNPMDCNTLGFPVLHCLLELAQTHVHWVGDAIQPETYTKISWLGHWFTCVLVFLPYNFHLLTASIHRYLWAISCKLSPSSSSSLPSNTSFYWAQVMSQILF